jgi:hypothetical protein
VGPQHLDGLGYYVDRLHTLVADRKHERFPGQVAAHTSVVAHGRTLSLLAGQPPCPPSLHVVLLDHDGTRGQGNGLDDVRYSEKFSFALTTLSAFREPSHRWSLDGLMPPQDLIFSQHVDANLLIASIQEFTKSGLFSTKLSLLD